MFVFKKNLKFNNSQKNILIINGSNHSLIGGTENYTYKLIKIFTNLGHNVFELNTTYKNFNLILKNYENIKHKITELNKKSTKSFLFYFAYFINAVKFNLLVHKILKEKKIDIVVDNTEFTSYKFFKHSFKKKFIWVAHNDVIKMYNEKKSFWWKIKAFIALKSNRFYFNRVVVFTKKDKESLLNLNKKINPNSIYSCPLAHKNLLEFNNFSVKEKINQSKKIVYMGRINQEQKNIKFISKIAEKLISDHIYIYIYGEGADKNFILNKPGIKYEGAFKKNEVNHILKEAKLLILPSFYEGFPYVVVEALSNGVPCLIANTFNNADYLVNETRGKLFNNFEADYWAKEIKFFYNLNKNDYAKFAKNALNFAKENLANQEFENFWRRIIKI